MENIYQPIKVHSLPADIDHARPLERRSKKITLDSPAIETMTDFSAIFAETIAPDIPMEEANRVMIRRGIGLLLVVGSTNHVIGLLSVRDLTGEKPMQYIQEHGGHHDDIRVRDVMTPHEKLDMLAMHDVAHARVGHIVTTLKMLGRQHILVTEQDELAHPKIRGIFSASQIARQLGIAIESPHEIANTFAQIEATLAR